jgi:hypothetical protein
VLECIRHHEANGGRLTPAAKFLAVVLARRTRLTDRGSWVVWRGCRSLAELTGFSVKTLETARNQLLGAGLFAHISGVSSVLVAGQSRPVARGVKVLSMVIDVEAFLQGREQTRARLERERLKGLHEEKLALQKQLVDFGGSMSLEDYRRAEAQLTRRRRATRKAG